MTLVPRVEIAAPAWLASDVRWHLTQTPRQLPARALYDDLGSALFDAICWLPWYPVTRAECRLLDRHGRAIMTAAGEPSRIAELGCGNGSKLVRLLRSATSLAGAHRGGPRHVDLVDVSPTALAAARRAIGEQSQLEITTHLHPYETGLREVAARRRDADRLCVLFLGSNIGNFDPPAAAALLRSIRCATKPLDALLLGVDLVKREADLLAAYDDPLGLTAAFNKNLLVRLNRELGATFDVSAFDHRAVWNSSSSRVEMHLVSNRRQRVEIPYADLAVDFAAGEWIWTESSYKFTPDEVSAQLDDAGFEPVEQWIDPEGQFLLVLSLAR
jgi:dimethylhistidine N-methyltransferase